MKAEGWNSLSTYFRINAKITFGKFVQPFQLSINFFCCCEYRMKSFVFEHWKVCELWPRLPFLAHTHTQKKSEGDEVRSRNGVQSKQSAKRACQNQMSSSHKSISVKRENSTCKSVSYPVDGIRTMCCQLNWWNRACVRVCEWYAVALNAK